MPRTFPGEPAHRAALPVGICALDQDGVHDRSQKPLQLDPLSQAVAGRVHKHGPQGFLRMERKGREGQFNYV